MEKQNIKSIKFTSMVIGLMVGIFVCTSIGLINNNEQSTLEQPLEQQNLVIKKCHTYHQIYLY